MRPRWLAVCLWVFLNLGNGAAFAQNNSQQEAASGQDSSAPWKLANFTIFAVALGWFYAKTAPRFFNARSADIQKAIKEATGLKMDADLRYSEIDRKMAALAEAVKGLRDQSAIEMEQAHQQTLRETEQQIQHIRDDTAAEIEALRQESARRAKRQTARLTLLLAEQRLRKQLSETEPENLFREFVALLEQGKN